MSMTNAPHGPMGASTAADVNAERLWQRLMALAEIGATVQGGVNRQALSREDIAACRQMVAWGAQAGLQPSIDAAGNLFLTLKSAHPIEPPLLLGSHLDSQPNGGKFDGALGVVAALEVAASLAQRRAPIRRDVVVAAWMNEEGGRFAPGMMGSEAFTGERGLDQIRAARDIGGQSVGDALDGMLQAFGDIERVPLGFEAGAYLELHIEQGPLLEAAGIEIGVVTGIQGKKTFEVRVRGAQGHAGTLPMAQRRDALAAFVRVAAVLSEELGAYDERVKFTIGRLQLEPNAPSVVPALVSFSIDLRHPDNAVLERLGARLLPICERWAAPCSAEVRPLVDSPSNVFDAGFQALIGEASRLRGRSSMPILSAAGHDARHLAKRCPSAMIFVPCRGGVSHSESEWIEPEQATAGLEVLTDVVERLAVGVPADGPAQSAGVPPSFSSEGPR
jgi:N-carbamoyl-L-amino-acid hydrolase